MRREDDASGEQAGGGGNTGDGAGILIKVDLTALQTALHTGYLPIKCWVTDTSTALHPPPVHPSIHLSCLFAVWDFFGGSLNV